MKYAVTYYSSFKYLDEVDEIISYNHISELIDRVREDQRIIFDITEEKNIDFNKFIEYKEKHNNFAVKISFLSSDTNLTYKLKKLDIPFMFKEFANNFSTVYAMAETGAKDIYIVEDICFSLDKLQNFKEQGIQFRVLPNIAQVSRGCADFTPQISQFWIRPEDTAEYEPFVDVFELFTVNNNKLSVIYEIYRNRSWLGNISDIIIGLDLDIQNTNFIPMFGHLRPTCGKTCMYKECSICTRVEDLSNLMNKQGLEIVSETYKKELTEEEKEKYLDEFKQNKTSM